MGLTEDAVSDRALGRLARQARAAGARLEVNEKWACPSARHGPARSPRQASTLVASTDSHDCRDIGVYDGSARIADGALHGAVP